MSFSFYIYFFIYFFFPPRFGQGAGGEGGGRSPPGRQREQPGGVWSLRQRCRRGSAAERLWVTCPRCSLVVPKRWAEGVRGRERRLFSYLSLSGFGEGDVEAEGLFFRGEQRCSCGLLQRALLPAHLPACWEGPGRGAARFLKLLYGARSATHFSGTGMEPILIRVGETRSSEGHREAEVLSDFFGFLPLQGEGGKKIERESSI